MKTPEEWIASKTHCANKLVITDRFKEADIAAIQSDALAAGERKGRIAGLREAADRDINIANGLPKHQKASTYYQSGHAHQREADRLEREDEHEAATGKEGSQRGEFY